MCYKGYCTKFYFLFSDEKISNLEQELINANDLLCSVKSQGKYYVDPFKTNGIFYSV